MLHNITEASFDKASPLWFAFLLMRLMLQVQMPVQARASTGSTLQPPRQFGILPRS
jgi:hypothetical protein